MTSKIPGDVPHRERDVRPDHKTLRRSGVETVALHFGDQQLQMRGDRLRARGTGFRFAGRRPFGGESGAERFDVEGNRFVQGNDSTTIRL
jgi:hypothetical protein